MTSDRFRAEHKPGQDTIFRSAFGSVVVETRRQGKQYVVTTTQDGLVIHKVVQESVDSALAEHSRQLSDRIQDDQTER